MINPSWRLEMGNDGKRVLRFLGTWTLIALNKAVIESTAELVPYASNASVRWDLSQLEAIDSAAAMLFWELWGKTKIPNVTMRPEHEPFFARLEAIPPYARPKRRTSDPFGFFIYIGNKVFFYADHFVTFLRLIGRLILDIGYLIKEQRYVPWREISANVYKGGVSALSVTALVGFLIGVVVSYLSALQLKTYGAEVFIINLLGFSIIRELGPVLAAILIAGRSGSAMTAQLGVMRVTEEIDALATMGVSRSLRLVLPKVVAMAIAMPFIVLWSIVMALLGGMISAKFQLGIGYVYFLETIPRVIPIANLWIGLGKGFVFGILIAVVACHYGLRIRPNTESLSTSTTSSVVTSIMVVILVDAIFAVMTKDIGFAD